MGLTHRMRRGAARCWAGLKASPANALATEGAFPFLCFSERQRSFAFSTMQRPRKLDLWYAGNTTLSQLTAIVVGVVNIGTASPALASLELVLDDNPSAPLTVYSSVLPGSGAQQPACAALNQYPVAEALTRGPRAGARVVGVRLTPSQARVASKKDLIHVSGD